MWKRTLLGLRMPARFYNQPQRQHIIHQLQNNHNITPSTIQTRNLLRWSTVIFLVAASSSTTMALYLGVEVYRTYKAQENKTRTVFLPLWLSFNWPYQRRYDFASYLKYVDPAFDRHIASADDFVRDLLDHDVQYQVLDTLLRLKTARDLFGVPLSLRSDDGGFSIWIEPKWPLVHGPLVEIAKKEGQLGMSWKWYIKPIKCSSVDGFVTALGIKLDKIDPEAQIKTHESSSGRVHEANHMEVKSVTPDDKDYTIAFEGKLTLANKQNVQCGVVSYGGVIDFNHLGISNGVKILLVDLTVNSNDTPLNYKLR